MPSARALHETPLVIPARVLQRSGRRWVLLLSGLVAAVTAGLALRAARKPAETAHFRTAPVVRRTVIKTVEAAAQVDVGERFDVGTPVKGRLAQVLVEPGVKVTRGQALAKIDEQEARHEIASARAAEQVASGKLEDAQAAYDAAVDVRKRTEKLVSLELAQARHLAAAKTAEARALGALKAARGERGLSAERLRAADQSLKARTLRSPADGVVLVSPQRLGAMVGPEAGPLFVIGSTLDQLVVHASVAEADIGPVHPGQRAEFTVPAFPDRTFEARVTAVQIEPEQQRGVVSYPVLLEAANPDRLLLPRMTATVRIEVARAEGVLAVREAALRFSPDEASACPPRSCVWLSSDGIQVEKLPVAVGISDGDVSEVRPTGGPLRPGDPVVIGLVPSAGERPQPGITLGGKR